ncbi:MAG: hypothetical protein C5B51_01185 [Terriglobia bacterium]|nr:MAG: hypothetical protein C5B51_01185 [Terriglobia bacterium]
MRRILLIAPKFDPEYSLAFKKTGITPGRVIAGSIMAPLGLTTIAALTPDDWEVTIWDEAARGEITDSTDLGADYSLAAMTAYISHIPRAIELARVFRRRGIPVAIGGPGVSSAPEQCRPEFDVVFLGEAEFTWGLFLKEFKLGRHRSEYRQVERPDLATTPVPRWELLQDDIPRYQMLGVQTTRGCPFDCDFCDVIHLFGRKPRHKLIDTVLKEFTLLQKLGGRRIFLCDDDFIGDYKYAQDLLTEMVGLNRSFDEPLNFTTQCTIDLAKRDTIMKLMADANFQSVFVGVETPRKESLKEVNKLQNMQGDMVENLRKIQSYGLMIKSGLIVGFDSDDKDVFQEHVDLAENANLVEPTARTLKAMPGTPQWMRFQREGRILDVTQVSREFPRAITNITPKQMTLPELMERYEWLTMQLRDWKSFRRRTIRALRDIKYVPEHRRDAKFELPKQARQNGKGRPAWRKNLSWEAKWSILSILFYTWRKRPHMAQYAVTVIAEQLVERSLLSFQHEVIQKLVALYNAGELKPDLDDSVGMIPHDFEKTVAKVMPVIYDRLWAELEYKPAIPEAYVDIMKDFLIRWGKGFQGFEDYHMTYLNELCDRHIERWNQKRAEGKGQVAETAQTLKREQTGHFKFIREVLVAVDQELRGEARLQQAALVQIAGKSA